LKGLPAQAEHIIRAHDDFMEWASELMDDALDSVDACLNSERGGLTINISSSDTVGASKRLAQTHEQRPQDLFHDPVDNRNQSWTPWTAIGGRPPPREGEGTISGDRRTHPLAREIEGLRYLSWQLEAPLLDPIPQPQTLSATPFLFVDSELTLDKMTTELNDAFKLPQPPSDAILAIDLENHSYHSFHGFTCLIQMSTRDKDYVIDPLSPVVRSKVGKALWPFLTHPSIIKVLHGSDRDIEWLQRDFGLCIVNLFDTGQAARVLSLPSASLAFLLETFCGVVADKRLQLADWRIRPLTAEMMTYARGDTHHLPYLYDRLRVELLSLNPSQVPPLLAAFPLYAEDVSVADGERKVLKGALGCVLERSRKLCLNVYERELIGACTAIDCAIKYGLRLNP
jgi:exosome complex exonuclease RRP6